MFSRAIIAAWLSQLMTTLLFFVSHCRYFSLKHSGIVANVSKMNGFFGDVIVPVVDEHTCSSPVGAISVAVDVVVDRFEFFVIFSCLDVHNKVRV